MKIYIAGPMSGIAQFNYPAFDRAAASIRELGFDARSPAEMDSPEVRALALASTTGDLAELKSSGETWGDMLAADVKMIADELDGVCLLEGWHDSRGARLEAFVCLSVRKPLYRILMSGKMVERSPQSVLDIIYADMSNAGRDESRYRV